MTFLHHLFPGLNPCATYHNTPVCFCNQGFLALRLTQHLKDRNLLFVSGCLLTATLPWLSADHSPSADGTLNMKVVSAFLLKFLFIYQLNAIPFSHVCLESKVPFSYKMRASDVSQLPW